MIFDFIYKPKNILLLVILLYFAIGCSTAVRKEMINAQFYYDRGMEYMEKRDYVKAITDFQTVVESYQGSEIVDKAQFMLAEAHFMNEDYLTAAYEYERVYSEYPSSTHVPEAWFKKALCYYNESPKAALDQDNTQVAIDEFNRFIDNFPRHELAEKAQEHIEELRAKLALKEYKNAELYRKLKKYESAIIYYRFVIKEYPRSIWANEARYGLGLVYLKQKNYERAKEMFQFLVNTDVNKDLKDKASKKLGDIEKQIE